MCWCTPNIRTPFCGRASCVPPRSQQAEQAAFVGHSRPSQDEIDALVAETLDAAEEFQKPKTVTLAGLYIDALTSTDETAPKTFAGRMHALQEAISLPADAEAARLADLQARATLTPGEMHELKFLVDRKWAKKGGAA